MPYTDTEYRAIRTRIFLAGSSFGLAQQYLVRRAWGALRACDALAEAREILSQEVPF